MQTSKLSVIKSFLSTTYARMSSSSFQMLIFRALMASFLIGNGLVYGHFRLFHLVGIVFLPFFLAQLFKSRVLMFRIDLVMMLLVLAWYVLSVSWAKDLLLARNYLFYLLNGYYVVFAVCCFTQNYDQLVKLMRVLFYVLAADLGVGVLEATTKLRWFVARQSSLNHYFGIDPMYDYYYRDLASRVQEHPIAYEFMQYQPSGFHWGPNQFGLVLCVILPFFLFYVRRFWLSTALSALTIYLSFMIASRAVFLSELLIFLISVVVFLLSKSTKKMLFSIVMSLFLILAPLVPLENFGVNLERSVKISSFLGAAKSYLQNNLNFDFTSLSKYSPEQLRDVYVLSEDEQSKLPDNSVSQRKIMIIKAYDEYKFHPIRGVGVGGSAQDVGLLFGITQIHNFWIEIFFELGAVVGSCVFIGVLILFLRLISLTRKAIKSNNEDYKNLLLSVTLSLLAVFPGVLAVGTGAYQSIVWILLAFSLATAYVMERELKATQ